MLKNDGQPTFLTTISESSDQKLNTFLDTISTQPTSTSKTPLRPTMASPEAQFLVSSSLVHPEKIFFGFCRVLYLD